MIDTTTLVVDAAPLATPCRPPTLHDVEIRHIQAVLMKHGGDKTTAAKELGICLKTLYNKINQHQHMRDQWLGRKGGYA